jgi:hypothetical protein
MAYKNALPLQLRGDYSTYPFYNKYGGVTPYLSMEFKASDSPADCKEAVHQIAIHQFLLRDASGATKA